SQLPCELEVHGVVIPDSRGDWVELLSPRHTLFVAHGEDFREVVSREVKRVVAALDPKPAEFFALIPPALGCSLEPLEIELELVTDPGGGSVAQRRARLTLREQRRRALEVLGSVSQRWQRSRDELRDTQASGGPTW